MEEGRDRLVAAAALVAAAGLFAVMGALVKLVGDRYPLGQIVFFRGAFALVVLLALVPFQGGVAVFRPARPAGLVARALAGLTAMTLIFAALPHLPLAEAAALGFTTPLLTTALAGPLLGEMVGLRRWLAVLIGFLGVLLVVQPGGAAFNWAALLALSGAFFGALAMLAIRHLGKTERALTVALSYTLITAIFGALTLPFSAAMPDPGDFVLLASIGLVGGFGQICLTHAYRSAAASFVAPFEYTALIWSTGLGLLLFGHLPGPAVLFGAALVVAAGLIILLEQRRPAPQSMALDDPAPGKS
jgi:drug/metabolite transporter (DMT)-like permease